MEYKEFIKNKIAVSPLGGFEVPESELPICLLPHQRDIVRWALRGGQRAIFASFGLGKTLIQIAIMDAIGKRHPDCKTLIVAPLGVKQEFARDAKNFFGRELKYVRTNEELATLDGQHFITNYERVRDGQLAPEKFIAVSLDEASILRGFGTKTYQELLPLCRSVKYKFVATATPSPNELKELIHYAGFLGVMDTGEALTRFFQRNSEKAGDLTLYPHKEREFWLWVSSWAVFLNKPSDLGYSDEGYDLPPLKVVWHRVEIDHLRRVKYDRDGQGEFFHDAAKSLPDAAREKRDTIPLRAADTIYDYTGHVEVAEAMEKRGRLPATFETFRVPARTPWVWDDVVRMRTLNGEQSRRNLEKHICPLQFDIVERVIERWSNPGEVVYDPFGGIMTVPYCAVKMGRFGIGVELNTSYWHDGCRYLDAAEAALDVPTLFDVAN